MRKFTNQKGERKEVYESILIALFINVPAINTTIASIIPGLAGGIMAILYLGLFCLLLINFVFNYLKRSHIETLSSIMVMFTIIIAYIFTWINIGNQLSIFNLIIYVFLPLLIISKMDIKGELVIEFCVLIPAIGIPFFPIVFQQTYNSISMGLSYAFLPAIVFASAYLLTCPKKNTIITIASVIDLIYFVLIFLYGSRGVVLSGFIAALLLWLNQKKLQHEYDKFFVMKVICIGIVFVIIVMFRWEIVYSLYDFFTQKGITVEFFDKLIRLEKMGGIDNGRNDIIKVFYPEFLNKPLLGHGIKSFEYYTGIIYPHNFIYQLLFDLGIIGTLIIMIPICLSVVKIFKRIDRYENATLLITLMCASIPGALLSQDLWLNPLLWLMFSLVLRLEYRK